jgi:hypothetical protein
MAQGEWPTESEVFELSFTANLPQPRCGTASCYVYRLRMSCAGARMTCTKHYITCQLRILCLLRPRLRKRSACFYLWVPTAPLPFRVLFMVLRTWNHPRNPRCHPPDASCFSSSFALPNFSTRSVVLRSSPPFRLSRPTSA